MTTGYRERAHEATRAELAAAAFALILENGYETQSAEDLAHGLGISRATFFRYLGSKDDVVISAMLGPIDQFSSRLREASDHDFPNAWMRLRAALETAVELADEKPDEVRARLSITQMNPMLGARIRRARVGQVDALSEVLVELGHSSFEAMILASAAITALDASCATWAQEDGRDLRSVLDEAFATLVRAGLPLID